MEGILKIAKKLFCAILENRRKHAPILMFTLLVVGGVFLIGEPAHADGVTGAVASALSWILEKIEWVLGKLFLVVVAVLLQAMNFSNFINAAPVVAGWIVVRDLTNLLFIIVLLVISFGIIFGVEKYGNINMIPKMFIMAIAINFSRTIVGFLVDISQVFMLTFTRAFTDAGASNFVDVFSVDVAKNMTGASEDLDGAILTAHIAATIMLLVATVICAYLAVLMMVRIVVIWILIVIAPLAWFTYIIKDWFGNDSPWDQWWHELKPQLVVGPIMAFFMWLALATASGGATDFVNFTGPGGGKLDGLFAWAPVEAGTTLALIKAIIAAAILVKGLEIAQKQGGVGSGLIGKAGAMSQRVARGALALGGAAAVGVTSASIRGGMRLAGGTAEGGAGAFRQGLTRYGQGQTLIGTALSDVGRGIQAGGGGLITAAQRATGGRLPGASALQRKISQAGGAVSGFGAKMTKTEEEAMKAQVATGTPEVTASQMSQLMSLPPEARSSAQKLQFKQLSEAIEKEPKAFAKLSDSDKMNYLKARSEITGDIKDRTARDTAQHHDEEFMAKNVHNLPVDKQAETISHLPPEFQAKVSSQAFTIDEKTLKSGDAAKIEQERTRVAANLKATAEKNPEAIAGRANSDGAILTSLKGADSETFEKVFKTGRISPKNMDAAWAKELSGEQAKVVMQYADTDDRKEISKNKQLSSALNGGIEKWKQDGDRSHEKDPDAGSAEERATQVQTMLVNLDVLKARMAANPNRLDATVDTIGLGGAGPISENAKKNLTGLLGNNSHAADLMLAIPMDQLKQKETSEVVFGNISLGALTELAKRKVENKLSGDEIKKVEAIIAHINGITTEAAPEPPGLAAAQDALQKAQDKMRDMEASKVDYRGKDDDRRALQEQVATLTKKAEEIRALPVAGGPSDESKAIASLQKGMKKNETIRAQFKKAAVA